MSTQQLALAFEPIPSGLCQCGCGEPTRVARFTVKRDNEIKGVPLRFLRGHQRRTKESPPIPQPPNPSGLCLCGCGEATPVATHTNARECVLKGQPQRFIPGHHSRRTLLIPPPRLCACGCGGETTVAVRNFKTTGIMRGERHRFCPNHCARRTPEERFWEKVNVDPDGCWLWTGCDNGAGYGSFSIGYKRMLATHFSWELANGPVPEGLDLCHDCDQFYPIGDITYRRCVRPDHLFLGTAGDNIRDCFRKGRMPTFPRVYGEAHPFAVLTEEKVRAIRALRDGGMQSPTKIGKLVDASVNAVTAVMRGITWKHVE